MGKWDKYEIPANTNKWDKYEVRQDKNTPEVSPLETIARGGAQGVTSGFADEATALAEGLISKKPFKETYDKSLKESRANYKAAHEANPVLSTVSDFAGSVLQPTPFGKVGAAGKAANLGIRAAQAGLMGGLEAVGRSEDNDISDFLAGGLLSGAATYGLGKAGQVGGKLFNAAKDVLPSKLDVISHVTNKPVKGLQAYADNPKLINKLDELGDTNQIMGDVVERARKVVDSNPFKRKADEKVKSSYDVLTKSDTLISPQAPIEVIDSHLAKLQALDLPSDVEKRAYGILDAKKNELLTLQQKYTNGIPARNVKSILQSIDKDVSEYGGWGNPYSNTEVGNAFKDVRRAFDADLKMIPEYKKLTDSASKLYGESERLVDGFITKKYGDANIKKLASTLQSGTREKITPYTKDDVRLLDKTFRLAGEQPIEGMNLQTALRGVGGKAMFDAPSNQGSNVMNYAGLLGAGIGGIGGATQSNDSVLGGGTGIIGGALAGRYLERNAGKLAKKAIDFKMPMKDVMNRVQGTKYADYLSRAAEISPRKFAVNMYLLQQKDPEFRNITQAEK